MSKTRFWVVLALLSFVVARLYYFVFVAPDTLNQDEAALLMNARFIAESGVDEWQRSWPVVFRSFGDAKLPGYIYVVAALGKLIGFTVWTVRLPAFLAGCLLPLFVYVNAHQWTGSQKSALVASLLLVISPWSWHYGSIGFEATVGLTLFLAGSALVFRRPASWLSDFLAATVFFIGALTYNTPWILLPVLGMALILWRWGNWKELIRVGVLMLLVFAGGWGVTAAATTQKGAITIFQDPTLLQLYPEYRAQFSGVLQTLLGNKYVYFFQLAADRWFDSWSWNFLVTRGGENPWHTIPGVGHLHAIVPGMSVVGAVFVFFSVWKQRTREIVKRTGVLIWLLVASLLPSILTVDAPHATRSLFFFVMVTILAGYGLGILYDELCRHSGSFRVWNAIRFGFVLFLVWGFAWWWWPAKIRWEYMLSPKWNAGLSEVLKSQRIQEAEQVFIWDPNGNRYPYAVLAEDISADIFGETVQRSNPDTVGLVRVERVGKYVFVFEHSDFESGTGVYLEPSGNTSWDIVE